MVKIFLFLNPYIPEFSDPQNPENVRLILVTLIQKQPHNSQSSRENATLSSGIYTLAYYWEVPPPPPRSTLSNSSCNPGVLRFMLFMVDITKYS